MGKNYLCVPLVCVDRERDLSLSPHLKEEFSLYQKLWDFLDFREKVDKSDTNLFIDISRAKAGVVAIQNQI